MDEIDNYQLEDYIISCVHFYGMIHKKRISKLYHLHFQKNIISFFDLDDDYLKDAYVYFDKEFFIHESIYMFNKMSEFIKATNGKPLYLPSYEELISSRDDEFELKTDAQKKLFSYIKSIKTEVIAENIVDSISVLTQMGSDIESILRNISTYNFREKQFDQMIPHILNIHLNVRSWHSNGYKLKEIKDLYENIDKINKNDLCPCGSQKKYEDCCMKAQYIGENNPDIHYDDVFKINSEDVEAFRMTLQREKDRILFHIGLLEKPSLGDLINQLVKKDIIELIDIKANLIVAALVQFLFELHDMNYTDNRKKIIDKGLSVLSKQRELDYVYEIVFDVMSGYDEDFDQHVVQRCMNFINEYSHTWQTNIKPFKSYGFLKKLQQKTKYDKTIDQKLESLSQDVYASNIDHKELYFYNLLHVYPLEITTLKLIQEFVDIEYEEDILKAIILAFNKSHSLDSVKPSNDFCVIIEQRIYIQALDELASIYKGYGYYNKALPLYERIIELDIDDKYGAKESILICYIHVKRINEFDDILEQLPDYSIYKQYMHLYNLIIQDKPIVHQYLKVKENYESVLDIICYGNDYEYDNENLSYVEQLFLNDFYQMFIQTKEVHEKLKQIHIENRVIT